MGNLIKKICRIFCGCKKIEPIPQTQFSLTTAERSTYANQLLLNPLWDELFEDLREDTHKLWIGTRTDDVEQREYLWQHFQLIGVIQRRVRGYISSATIENDFENKRQKNPQLKRDLRDGK